MIFQPLVYFTALAWLLAFSGFGVYALFQRGTVSLVERFAGLTAGVLVAALGAAVMIAGFYLIEELMLQL